MCIFCSPLLACKCLLFTGNYIRAIFLFFIQKDIEGFHVDYSQHGQNPTICIVLQSFCCTMQYEFCVANCPAETIHRSYFLFSILKTFHYIWLVPSIDLRCAPELQNQTLRLPSCKNKSRLGLWAKIVNVNKQSLKRACFVDLFNRSAWIRQVFSYFHSIFTLLYCTLIQVYLTFSGQENFLYMLPIPSPTKTCLDVQTFDQ